VARHGRTVSTADVKNDPRHFDQPGGQPGGQPGTVLAVPVIVKDVTVAVVNLERSEPHGFDDSDVKTMETLADQLAAAIENINLHDRQRDQSQRLAVADERDRIGRDLHDGVIQSMYAVGLTLEDIAGQADRSPEDVRPRIDGVVGDLNQVIRDIRRYIMDLRPTELQGRGWAEALASLTRNLEEGLEYR
jgi:signal transduction histidine kinase